MEHLHLLSNSTSPPIPTLPYCKPQSDFLLLVSRQSHSCIPTYPAFFSTILGFLSIASWLFAQLPQIVKNYRLKSTASLSFLFLLNWCFGDSLNFAGAVLLDQMTFQKVVAAYYVFVDVVLVGQWIWYRENDEAAAAAAASQASSERTITVRRGSGTSIVKRHSTRKGSLLATLTMLFTTSHAIPIASVIVTGPVARMITSSISPSSPAVSIMGSGSDLDDEYITRLGRLVAWLSTALYVSSRAPQLYLNYTRKSVSGLSPLLFLAAFCGNFFYTSSLLMNPCARKDIDPFGEFGWVGENGSVMGEWWKDTLPFMLGAAGVLGMDASVGIQFWLWGGNDDDNNAEVIVGVNVDDDDDDEYDYDGGDEGYTVEVRGKKSNGGSNNRAWKRFVGVDIKNEKAAEWNDNSRSATPTNYSETAALLVPRLGYGSFGRTSGNGTSGVGGGFGGGDIDADTVYGSTSSAGAMLEAEFGSVKGKGRGI